MIRNKIDPTQVTVKFFINYLTIFGILLDSSSNVYQSFYDQIVFETFLAGYSDRATILTKVVVQRDSKLLINFQNMKL